jgi:hypothetical protein
MSRHSLLLKLPGLISTPISTGLSTAVLTYLIDKKISEGVLWLVVATLFLALIVGLDHLIRIALSSWTWLRRMILQADFIEGVWCEQLLVASRAKGQSGVTGTDIFVMIVRPFNGKYEIMAYIFDEDGIEKGHSHSKFSEYQGDTLSYYFEGPWIENGKTRVIQGFANITFASTSDRRPPQQFSGSVAEFGQEMSQVGFTGHRLPQHIYPEAFDSLQTFAVAVREFEASLKAKGSQ